MDGKIDLTTIFFLVIALVVFFKLRSVLGRRTGDEEARLDRYRSQRTGQPKEAVTGNDKIVTLPRRDREDAKVETMVRETEADRNLRMTKFAGGDATIANGLIDIAKVDANFDPVEFMKGARAAYEMIVMAFAEGNKKLLADLLGPDVFSGFAAAIADREARKQTIEQSFVGITSADVVEAENKAGIAQVTVKFVSELITATRSASGEVVSGDPKRIKEVTDIWTFARDSASTNPNWKLVATQAAN